MSQVLILNGPNLNLLGQREPDKYGSTTLASIEANLAALAQQASIGIQFFQSNSEGALVDRVQAARGDSADIIICNPAAYSHTSVALRDSILAVGIPLIEVHLSNIYAREPFRHHSYFSDIAIGTLAGFGARGYQMAFEFAVDYLRKDSSERKQQ